jgi:hypothetical protein
MTAQVRYDLVKSILRDLDITDAEALRRIAEVESGLRRYEPPMSEEDA